jgi:hypothetical protein
VLPVQLTVRKPARTLGLQAAGLPARKGPACEPGRATLTTGLTGLIGITGLICRAWHKQGPAHALRRRVPAGLHAAVIDNLHHGLLWF